MKKQLLFLLLIVATLFSCQKIAEVPVTPEILSFEIVAEVDGESEVFAGKIEGNHITFTLPFNANLKAVVPYIECSDKTTVSPRSGVAKNFTDPVVYTATSGSIETKYTVTAQQQKKQYKIYQFRATKDVVIGMLDAFASPQTTTCLMTEARNAIDLRYLPKNIIFVANCLPAGSNYTSSPMLIMALDIARKDHTAEFTFYNSHFEATDVVVNQVMAEIGYDRCKFVYLEDGTADYIAQYNYFASEDNRETFENAAFLCDVLLNRQLTPAERNVWIAFNPLSIQQSLMKQPKAECWFNYPDAFNYTKFPMPQEFRNHYVQKEPLTLFQELSAEAQAQFLKSMKVDTKIFETTKPRLVITGGNDGADPVRLNAAQLKMVKNAIADYGDEYQIYFKGHPTNTSFEAILKTEFTNGEIVQIPNSIPFEVLNAAGLGGDKILGLHSTLYFGVPQDRIIAIYFKGTQITEPSYEYIREMMIPAGAYPSDMTKYKEFFSSFE